MSDTNATQADAIAKKDECILELLAAQKFLDAVLHQDPDREVAAFMAESDFRLGAARARVAAAEQALRAAAAAVLQFNIPADAPDAA